MTKLLCTYHGFPAPTEGAVRVQERTLDDHLPAGSAVRRGVGAHGLPPDIGPRARAYVDRFEWAGKLAGDYGVQVSIAYSPGTGLVDVEMDAGSDTMLRNGARAFFEHAGRPPEVAPEYWGFMDGTR